MITPTEIRQKAERWYIPFLRSWLQDEPFFPRALPAGSPPNDFVAFRDAVENLLRYAKERRGYGYSVETQLRRMRQHGDQSLPVRIIIETHHDFLQLIGKAQEFECFQQDIELIRSHLPQLAEWMIRSPQRILEQHGTWPDLLTTCAYFLAHPRPHLYIRELPIPVHTKFIEQHRSILRELLEQLLPADAICQNALTFEQRFGLQEDEPLVRVRLLDNQLLTRHSLPLTDISLPRSQFAAFELHNQICIVTENKMTFLTLPPLLNTFAIFGAGFMVNNLSTVSWLSTCPILYWGDIDAQGFQILSLLRSLFPRVISVMMDAATLQAFKQFWVTGTPCPAQHLPYLTPEEHMLFTHLLQQNIRLEQERISHPYAMHSIHEHLPALTP